MMAMNKNNIFIVNLHVNLYDRKSLIQNTKCSVPKSFGSHFQAFLIFLVIVLSSGCLSGFAVLLVNTNLGYH